MFSAKSIMALVLGVVLMRNSILGEDDEVVRNIRNFRFYFYYYEDNWVALQNAGYCRGEADDSVRVQNNRVTLHLSTSIV